MPLLRRLLGIDAAQTDAEWSLRWAEDLSGDAAVLSIALDVAVIALIVWLYRVEARHLPLWKRAGLAGLRLLAVGIAAAMLMQPVLVRQVEEQIPSHVVVLADVSESMTVRDAWADASAGGRVAEAVGLGGLDGLRATPRYEVARRVLDAVAEPLAAGGDRVVHVHPFGERLRGEVESLPETLEGGASTTAVATSLREALQEYSGRPLAGVVVLSDGALSGGDRIDAAAAAVAEGGVPVFAVPVGTVEGPRNAEVASVDAPPVVFTGDDSEVTVRVRSRGMRDQPATLTIEQRANGGVWEEVAREDLILQLDGEVESVSLPFKPDKPGKLEFRASLSDVGPELTTEDNAAVASTDVIRERLRVLLIAGSTFPEVQFLRNMLIQDKTVDVSTWLQSAKPGYKHPGDDPIRRLPIDQDELNAYDCVVLYDPDPDGWPANFGTLLEDFVGQAGGGLVLIAGEQQTGRLFDRQDDPAMGWLRTMPVVRQPNLFRSAVQLKLAQTSPWRLAITPAGVRDPIMQFEADSQKNVRTLESLPGMFWHFPVTRAKPGADVLAVHGDPRMRNEYGPEVLLATQRVGPGRTLFVGFDSTYRWRYLSEEAFNGFWRRVVDRAGRNKRLGGGYPFKLSTGRAAAMPGSEVKVLARFLNPTGPDAAVEELLGEVERGSDAPVPISLRPTERPGEFAGTFVPEAAGTHLVKVKLGDADAASRAATLAVDVVLPSKELAEPALNRESLATLASASGGSVVELPDAADLASRLTVGKVTRTIEERDELWDAPLLWGLLFLVLCVEWIARKRVRLI